MTTITKTSCPIPQSASSRRPGRNCEADTTGETHFGHCIHCGHHIGARTDREWTAAVRARCPSCNRPW